MSALAIEEAFAPLQDTRQAGKVEHRLMDILILALCGFISGAQSYTEIVQMSEERLEFFRAKLGRVYKLRNNYICIE
jgi:DDE_Tnp_1-associated